MQWSRLDCRGGCVLLAVHAAASTKVASRDPPRASARVIHIELAAETAGTATFCAVNIALVRPGVSDELVLEVVSGLPSWVRIPKLSSYVLAYVFSLMVV